MEGNKTIQSVVLVSALLIGACGNRTDLADAYGNFESDEITVSAETSGRLIRFDVEEGDVLGAGAQVALVDTVQLDLQRMQLLAQRNAIGARAPGIVAQIDVLEEQRRLAERERERILNLLADGAATQKQLDDIEGQIEVLGRQIASVRTQNAPLSAELSVVDAQLRQVEDRIKRSRVVNPVGGTVLLTYAEQHELVGTGQPLYKIARLDTVTLRAYVSGAQLSALRYGQEVAVEIDEDATTNTRLAGVITWISAQAEFTPKLIQTKEERVNLVYAFKVRVPNPHGAVKLGMPGEVWLEQ